MEGNPILLCILLAIYFAPIIVAIYRRHPNCTAIFWLNLLIGWTFIGWVVALVWSVIAFRAPKQVIIIERGERGATGFH